MAGAGPFEKCVACGRKIPLSDSHSSCLFCLGEGHPTTSCPHCRACGQAALKNHLSCLRSHLWEQSLAPSRLAPAAMSVPGRLPSAAQPEPAAEVSASTRLSEPTLASAKPPKRSRPSARKQQKQPSPARSPLLSPPPSSRAESPSGPSQSPALSHSPSPSPTRPADGESPRRWEGTPPPTLSPQVSTPRGPQLSPPRKRMRKTKHLEPSSPSPSSEEAGDAASDVSACDCMTCQSAAYFGLPLYHRRCSHAPATHPSPELRVHVDRQHHAVRKDSQSGRHMARTSSRHLDPDGDLTSTQTTKTALSRRPRYRTRCTEPGATTV